MHRDEVLFANDAFYLAFSAGDLTAMNELWTDRPGVLCVHPGWPALNDRETVMQSWARILGNPRQPRVIGHAAEVLDLGNAMLVLCYEQMEDTVMVASNVFVEGPDGPQLIVHHAGLCSDPPELPALTEPRFDA
jgi:hypothetical protein